MQVTRRDFLTAGTAAVLGAAAGASEARSAEAEAEMGKNLEQRPLRIGMTDWNLGQRGVIEKIKLANRIGLDGIQVSILYPEDGSLHLRCPKMQATFRNAALDYGVQICSLAIGGLGPGSPFKNNPMGVMRVADAIEVARNLGTNDILLPFFRDRAPDMSDKKEAETIINSFKELAPRAEKHGVVIALETSLSGEDHRRIIDAVGSPNIQVYFDPSNCKHYGHDPIGDILLLKDCIHQVHVKNNPEMMADQCVKGFSWVEVAELLYKIGYKGWYVLENVCPNDMITDTRTNIDYIRKTFRIPA
ncbi:MAG: sugar phosphate isomerase/epimerase family protein [Gemmatimonadota bacterium]|nr:sugar phosphate isomerase/epimerase family protein [Gemmatimonadota bacterium]